MPKGVNKKPDVLKPGEKVPAGVSTSDDLSTVDKGLDFVKPNEKAQISNRSI